MLSHRFAVGRAQGTMSRRGARRALSLLAALAVTLGLLPLTAPAASAATYTITGRVTGLSPTGTVVGVPDAEVWFYDADYNDVGTVSLPGDGTFTATFSAPGPYKIEAGCWDGMTCSSQWGSEWYANQGGFDSATPVTAGATATVANIQLDRRSTIKGTVKNTAGQPITAAEVSITKTGGGDSITATPAADGSFTLTGVEAGASNLTATDQSGHNLYENESWNGTSSAPGDAEWTVPAGTTVTGVTFVLDPWTGVVVKVTDSAGKPLQNINWNLFEYRPAQKDWFGRQYGPLLTGADGTFTEHTDLGTTYKVCVYDTWYENWSPATRYQDRCWNGATSLDTATPFTVSTSGRRDLTIVLPVAGKGLTVGAPFVSGSSAVGSSLSVDAGAWSPSGVALSYEWLKPNAAGTDLVAIPGATGRTFTVTSDLAGSYVTARVTGTLAGYRTAQVYANGVEVQSSGAPSLTSPLTITGSGIVGSSLKATHGTISPTGRLVPQLRLGRRRRRSGHDVGGLQPLALTSAMLGKRITLRMTAYLDGGSLQVSATGPVVIAGTVQGATPTITGTARVGSTLTANAGTWVPAPVTLAYQWSRAGTAVSGATRSTYALTAADLGKTMTVKVTGSKATYATTAKTSAATAAVVAGTLTAATPTISGTKAVGYTLTAVPGTWGPAPVTLAYQWFRSGAAISGATASTYKLTATDRTTTITVRVTGTRSGYTSTARTSAATTAVLGSFTAPTPTVSGTRRVGYTLTAVPSTWSPTPSTLAYQWYRSGTAISGASARTYKLHGVRQGHRDQGPRHRRPHRLPHEGGLLGTDGHDRLTSTARGATTPSGATPTGAAPFGVPRAHLRWAVCRRVPSPTRPPSSSSSPPPRPRASRRSARRGIEPVVVVSSVDEDLTVAEATDRYGLLAPADIALLLARAKAEDVAARLDDARRRARLRLGARARRRGARQAGRRRGGRGAVAADARPLRRAAHRSLARRRAATGRRGDPRRDGVDDRPLRRALRRGDRRLRRHRRAAHGRRRVHHRRARRRVRHGVEGDHHNVVGLSPAAAARPARRGRHRVVRRRRGTCGASPTAADERLTVPAQG